MFGESPSEFQYANTVLMLVILGLYLLIVD